VYEHDSYGNTIQKHTFRDTTSTTSLKTGPKGPKQQI